MSESETRERSALRELRDAVVNCQAVMHMLHTCGPGAKQENAIRHALMRATDVLGEGDAQ